MRSTAIQAMYTSLLLVFMVVLLRRCIHCSPVHKRTLALVYQCCLCFALPVQPFISGAAGSIGLARACV